MHNYTDDGAPTADGEAQSLSDLDTQCSTCDSAGRPGGAAAAAFLLLM